ncbi:low-affinity phosphate transporter Pho91p [[Candida] railenensis]|uniref:Low-affinity phosphate transporter Pho91p n=1 Tax=[Candida] railenensis TaxID=45579 RepID=A0A9P0VY82_9ASCO|nr:low-affinity phosphate transporter Pho91p [[Candida] railenensis]
MKFSHSLQFNAVPEWSSKYIAYTTLKKLIYSLQRDQLRSQREDDVESSLLYTQSDQVNTRQQNDPAVVFVAALDAELRKIDNFYKAQELFIFGNIEELVVDIETFENDLHNSVENNNLDGFSLTNVPSKEVGKNRIRANSDTSDNYRTQTDFETQNEDDEEDDDEDALGSSSAALQRVQGSTAADLKHTKSIDNYLKSPRVAAVWENVDNLPPQLLLLSESRVLLRKRVIGLYTTLSELESYIELNQTGFKKACKKFDKSLNTNIKDEYLNSLSEKSYIFRPTTIEKVKDNINSLTQLYALICNHQGEEGLEIAKQELSIHLREHVVWERNTVWRDMIGLERKTYGANSSGLAGKRNARGDGEAGNEKNSGKSATSLNFTLKNPSIIKGLVIFATFLILFNISIFEDKQQEHCFALLIVASLLWATETIPLFVTSLLIPVIIVSCNILKNDDGSPMSAPDSSKYILSTMWNSVILLLLGGFTLAAALSKYHIAKLISTWILSKAGTNPSVVLLTIMGVALFASMWVSNVAAPVLCFSLIQPLLRTLPRDSQFANALILGIALASNVGGMASPIASPQNIVAIGAMSPAPSWGQWFVIALPVCLLTLILIWIFLLTTFNCNSKNTHLVPIRVMDDRFTSVQWYISGVSIGTIFLWCIASRLEGTFGEMGIIALLPIVLFFGSGLLTTEDFNNYPWNIVVLAMGGTALGKAVASSGLLTTIAKIIQHQVADLSLFGVTLTFGLLILTMATFVSHTVAALIVIPLVSEIGNDMPEPHPNLLIMISALLCSAAMGLPTSGFPNVTAICMTDDFGKPYLTVSTFITRGVPSSIIAYVIIVSVGFTTMKLINF